MTCYLENSSTALSQHSSFPALSVKLEENGLGIMTIMALKRAFHISHIFSSHCKKKIKRGVFRSPRDATKS